MEWYEVTAFKKRVTQIEQYFVEIAANEELLLTYGFKRALSFPSAAFAFEALKTFNEDFSSLRRIMLRVDKALVQELEQLNTQGQMLEQVSLISLKLRMAEAKRPISAGIAAVNQVLMYLPYISRPAQSKGLFGEAPVSLQKTIINLERLKGLIGLCDDVLSNRRIADDDVFKPSNVSKDRVFELIEKALDQIDGATSISPAELERIKGYLTEAQKEATASNPSWSKIVGALVIVAALTSGLADAPNAAQTVKETIEYILGTSVNKPLQRYLAPPPSKSNDTDLFENVT